jgi:hypothetical protein
MAEESSDSVREPGADEPPAMPVLPPDSKKLVIASNPGIDVWDAASNTFSPAFMTGRPLTSLSFSRDGRYLVTRVYNGKDDAWDMAGGKHVGVLTSLGRGSAISPDSKRIAGGHDIETFPSLKPLADLPDDCLRLAWLPDGRAFVAQNAFWQEDELVAYGPHAVQLFQPRRPEAMYGLMWLPQFWLALVGIVVSALLIWRDIRRWRRNPPPL